MTVPWWQVAGQALGGGMDVFGNALDLYGKGQQYGLWGGSDSVSRRTSRRRGRQILEGYIEPTQNRLLGKAREAFEGAEPALREGYAKGRRALSRSASGSQRQAVERGRQQAANVTQSMTNQGLLGSSLYQAARMGVGANTSRVLADIRSRLAGAEAGLFAAEGQDVARARQSLGGFEMGAEAARRMPNLLRYNLWTRS